LAQCVFSIFKACQSHCRFSVAVVQVRTHMGVKFNGIDVLADP
jgi:glutaredoxin-related protein